MSTTSSSVNCMGRPWPIGNDNHHAMDYKDGRSWLGLLFVVLLLLIAVLIRGIGVAIRGSRRWVDIGPVPIQPSSWQNSHGSLHGSSCQTVSIEFISSPGSPSPHYSGNSIRAVVLSLTSYCGISLVVSIFIYLHREPSVCISCPAALGVPGLIAMAIAALQVKRFPGISSPLEDADQVFQLSSPFLPWVPGIIRCRPGTEQTEIPLSSYAAYRLHFAIIGEELGFVGAASVTDTVFSCLLGVV